MGNQAPFLGRCQAGTEAAVDRLRLSSRGAARRSLRCLGKEATGARGLSGSAGSSEIRWYWWLLIGIGIWFAVSIPLGILVGKWIAAGRPEHERDNYGN